MNEEQKVVSFTIEDCYHVCRLLYPDRSEKKKLKLAQRLHWKWQRRPPLEYQINEDSLTVSDKIILTKKTSGNVPSVEIFISFRSKTGCHLSFSNQPLKNTARQWKTS